MILCVAHVKGGIGKTLVAMSIAAVLAQRGRKVLLIDADEEGSAGTVTQIRADIPGAGSFATVQLYGAAIRGQIKQLREKFEEIIIDVGGRDTGSLRAALTVAEMVVIPFRSRSVDLSAGAKISELVSEARELNEDMRAYLFFPMADAQSHDNADPFGALKEMEGIMPLPLAIVRPKGFSNAFCGGLRVAEKTLRDAKAVDEFLSVVDVLYAREAMRPGDDELAEVFVAGVNSRDTGVAAPQAAKTVVNLRWDAELLRQIDQAAKQQGISRTAWLHVAAAEKLAT